MTAITEAPVLAPHLETLFTVAAARVAMGAVSDAWAAIGLVGHTHEVFNALKAFESLLPCPDRPMSRDDATLALLAAAAVCRGEPVAYTLEGLPVPQLSPADYPEEERR